MKGKNFMKKIIFLTLLGLLVFSITPALALNTGVEYGTYTGLGTKDLREGVMAIVNVIFGFLGILVIVAIVYGGFMMMTSGGNEEKTSEGRKVIGAGVIGLVILFSAYAISAFVISQLITATGAS